MAAGWSRSQALEPPSQYPLNMVEIDPTRGTDYRRVLLRNPREEETFRRVVIDPSLWVVDSRFMMGGRPIGLETLVEEHSARMHQVLDAQLETKLHETTLGSDSDKEANNAPQQSDSPL